LRKLLVPSLVIAVAMPPVALGSDQSIDLDGDLANGAESRVETRVLSTFPVQVENTVFNNVRGQSYNFKWAGAGPGGFNSYVVTGPDVGVIWNWSTSVQVYSVQSPITFTPVRSLPVFGTRPGGVQLPGAVNGEFTVPGKSIYPTQVTLSSASLTASLITFFSPEITRASCGVECESGECVSFFDNDTGGTITAVVEQQGCCPMEHQIICGDGCRSYLTDPNNCGGCGIQCGAGEICSEGVCACPAGQTACGDSCVDLESDPDNCGACGVSCGDGQFCSGGSCACTEPSLTNCGGTCVDLQSDPAHCGACGSECPAVQVCSTGDCDCPEAGQTLCGEACVDLQSDPSHCGDCEVECPGAQLCSTGVCSCPVAGQTLCGEACVDLLTNPAHCGACGVQCAAAQLCATGVCACPVAGQTPCGATCANLQGDPLNCGACGNACAQDESCTAGICTPVCAPGLTLCNGACVDLLTDPLNCGGCGNRCDGAGQMCIQDCSNPPLCNGLCISCGPRGCSQHSMTTLPDPGSTSSSLRTSRPRAEFSVSSDTSRDRKASRTDRRAASTSTPTTAAATETTVSLVTEKDRGPASRERRAPRRSATDTTKTGTTADDSEATGATAATTRVVGSIVEAPVCDLPPITQVIPSGGTFTQALGTARFGTEIATSARIQVDGQTLAQGPCPMIMPDPDADTTGVILAPAAVATTDASGDGLCQNDEQECSYRITIENVGDSQCLNPVATLTSPPDAFSPNGITFLNATSSYPSFPGYPGAGLSLEGKTNQVAFSVSMSGTGQAADVGRVFVLDVDCANLAENVEMPVVLGIGSACDPAVDLDGESFDRLDGFQSPVSARLVPKGNPVNISTKRFNVGSTVPLKLSLACGSQILGPANLKASPEIVALTEATLGPQSLAGINDGSNANPDDPFFSCGSTGCEFQLRTEQLPPGTYTLGIRMPDSRVFEGAFVLR
jgi:hypothetical protein